jgi:hypothetical protein
MQGRENKMNNAIARNMQQAQSYATEDWQARVREYFSPSTAKRFLQAMWEGDRDTLDEIAHCRCCCREHTYAGCPARLWYDCRGQFTDQYDEESWFHFYAQTRGMSSAEFYCCWDINEEGQDDE